MASLSSRLTKHLTEFSATKKHLTNHTQLPVTIRKILVDKIVILKTSNCKRRLKIIEAQCIKRFETSLNLNPFDTGKNVLANPTWND